MGHLQVGLNSLRCLCELWGVCVATGGTGRAGERDKLQIGTWDYGDAMGVANAT